ncbi:MAG: hypothetical protein K0U37_09060 [Gammaproteobacteria bacterium]|nr:hypothetical protein [Gammaproteobacteria bacterium]
MSYTKLNGEYQPFYFAGGKSVSRKKLLEEFDDKLELVLEKIRKEGTKEQQACIALYQSRADELRATIKAMPSEYDWYGVEMLARSIKTLDDGLKGIVDEENNQQSLLLARDLGREANCEAAAGAFFGFLAVTFTVIALVFAVPTAGISLLFLLELFPTGVGVGLGAYFSHQLSEAEDKVESFTDTSHGLFSGDSSAGTMSSLHQEDEHDERHGVDGGKSRHPKHE